MRQIAIAEESMEMLKASPPGELGNAYSKSLCKRKDAIVRALPYGKSLASIATLVFHATRLVFDVLLQLALALQTSSARPATDTG